MTRSHCLRSVKVSVAVASMAFLALWAIGLAQGSTTNAAPAKPAARGVLRIGMQYDLGNLDPAILTSVTDKQMSNNIYDGLVEYKLGTVTPEPDLATSWTHSTDGLQWTFKLRGAVKWQHGYGDFTANDVKFTFDRLKDPNLKSPNAKLLKAIKEVDVIDPYTVKLILSQPDPALLDKLCTSIGYIVSQKAVEAEGSKYGHEPVGTGEYQFSKWEPQQETVLVANPNWWKGTPGLGEVDYVPIPDATTMYGAFEAGNVDMIQVTDPDKLAQYKKDPNVSISAVPGLITRFFGMNVAVKPFGNKLVREAVTYAIDRKSILENVFKGMSTPASGILAPSVEHALTGIYNPNYDPEKAKELLTKAGLPNGFSTTMYVPNIDRFTKPATVIQANLQAVGINMKIQVMEVQTFLAKLETGKLPMFILSRGQDGTPDRVLYTWFSKDGIPANNWANINIPQVNADLAQATSTLDESKRQQLFADVQRTIVAGDYYYYLDHENDIFALNKKVKGFVGDPMRSIRLDNVTIGTGN